MQGRNHHGRRRFPVLGFGWFVAWSSAAAMDLQPLSSVDLHRACVEYLASPQGAEGTRCDAYVRGFVEGSSKVVVQAATESQRSAFRERALRTRLGWPKDPRPTYCIDSATSMQQFVSQLVEQAAVTPPLDNVDASALLVAMLQRYHTCEK